MDTAELAVEFGMAPGVTIADSDKLKLTGSVVQSKLVDAASPIVYGYTELPSIFSFDGPIFNLSNTGRAARRTPLRRPETARHGPRHGGRPGLGRGPAPGRGPRGAEGRTLGGAAPDRRAEAQQPLHHSARSIGRGSRCATATPRTCSSRACSRAPPRSRSTRRSWTCPSRRGTSSSFPTTRSGAARPGEASASSSTRS